MLNHVKAKLLAIGVIILAAAEQASTGHFPQNKAEWAHFALAFVTALGLRFAAATDGTR